MKNEAKLREEYANFQGKGFKHIKRENHQKFKPINDILYSWFKKCESSGIFVNGPLLKEEAMSIKQSLNLQNWMVSKPQKSGLINCIQYKGKSRYLANPLMFLKLQWSLGWNQ